MDITKTFDLCLYNPILISFSISFEYSNSTNLKFKFLIDSEIDG